MTHHRSQSKKEEVVLGKSNVRSVTRKRPHDNALYARNFGFVWFCVERQGIFEIQV